MKRAKDIPEKFLKTPWAIVFAEEFAEETKNRILEELEPMLFKRKTDFLITVPIYYRTKTIKGTETILDVTGTGRLREFSVISPSSDFSVDLITNRGIVISDTYTNLSQRSAEWDFLVAIPKDSGYQVKVSDISFDESLKIVLSVNSSPITFQDLKILYDIIKTR